MKIELVRDEGDSYPIVRVYRVLGDGGNVVGTITEYIYDTLLKKYIVGPVDPDTGQVIDGVSFAAVTGAGFVEYDLDGHIFEIHRVTDFGYVLVVDGRLVSGTMIGPNVADMYKMGGAQWISGKH